MLIYVFCVYALFRKNAYLVLEVINVFLLTGCFILGGKIGGNILGKNVSENLERDVIVGEILFIPIFSLSHTYMEVFRVFLFSSGNIF